MSLPDVRPPRDPRPAYIGGLVVLVVGLAIAAFLLNMPPFLVGIGFVLAAGAIFVVGRRMYRRKAGNGSK